MNIEAIAIDDEPKALEVIQLLSEKVPFLTLKATFTDAFKAIPYLQQHHVDLLFLDIKMPDISGLEFLHSLPNKPKVIFTTAYSEYAVEAFDLDAVDYIMKPFSLARFSKACTKVLDSISGPPKYVFLKTGLEEEKVAYDDIHYVVSQGNYMEYHLTEGKKVVRQTLLDALQVLPNQSFYRIHRSYIISLEKIQKVSRTSVWVKGIEIPIGSSFEDIFAEIREKLIKRP